MKTRPRPRRPPLPRRPLEGGLAIVAAALVVIAVSSLGGGSSSSSAATRRTATVGRGVVQSTVSGNGTLEPAQEAELSFGTAGEVTAIDVKAGETVKKGQVLAAVDSSSARATLASAEAALIEAEEAVEAAEEAEAEEEEGEGEEAAYDGGASTVFVGLMSKEGTAAATGEAGGGATAGEEEAEAAPAGEENKGAKESAKGGKEEATSPATAKGKEEATSPTTAKGEEAEAPEESKEAAGGSGGSAPTESSEASAGGAGASVSLPTAEANLRKAELTVKSARQEVRETTLRAPISGTVASISGSVGENVSGEASGSAAGSSEAAAGGLGAAGGESSGSGSSSAFMVIAQLHRLKMEVGFSESDIGKVRKGQTATVSIDSMEGTELAGRVTKVSLLPGESGSVVEYPATILLTQSAKGLRAGMSASAEVVVEQVKNAITVTGEALSGKTVTVEEGGKEVTKAVTTGLEGDETTQIISGLKVGDTVVLPEAAVATSTTGGSAGGSERGAVIGAFPAGGANVFSGAPPSGGFRGP